MAAVMEREELSRRLREGADLLLLDVRDTPDYEKERLPGAVHVLIPDLEQKVGRTQPRERTVVTYSMGPDCPASTIAAGRLEELGFHRVYDYRGSFADWKGAGLPTEF